MSGKPPVNVSPLIKTFRWGFLLTGIVYGSIRHKTLSRMEKKRLAELERTRPEREAKAAAEKARRNEEEMKMLKDAGVNL